MNEPTKNTSISRPKIHLGMVLYNRDIDYEILMGVVMLVASQKYEITMEFITGPYIDQNRNKIAKDFLKSDNEWWLSWDSDVVVKDWEFVDKLLETASKFDAQISAGCYQLKHLGSGHYPICNKVDGQYPNMKAEDLKEPRLVDVAAIGISLIHRSVFEKLEDPYFENVMMKNGEVWPEDFNFCERATKAGFKIAVDPRFNTYHFTQAPRVHHFEGEIGEQAV